MINIYLRHAFYSPNSSIPNRKRPEWFDKKKIFNNVLGSISSNCKLKIIYDAHFGDNSSEFFNDRVEVIKINQGTEAGSFLNTLEIIKNDNLPKDEIIYLMEDDYIHRPGWEQAMLEGHEISDYVSLYDHLDKYLYYPGLKSELYITKSAHWRTTPSTCNTYSCKAWVLKADFDIHRQYSVNHNNGISNDNGKFIHLGNIGRKLINPIPGFSTHCDLLQSPIIDWERHL